MLTADDGRIVFTFGDGRTNGIATINVDGSGYHEIVPPGPSRDQPHGGTEYPRWAPGDRIVFDSNRSGGVDDFHIFSVGADSGDIEQLTGGDDGIEYQGVMSPDGMELVYGKAVSTPAGPDPFRDAGLFASNADGTNERQLTTAPPGGFDELPDFSPDGQWIAFARGRGEAGGLFIVKRDGTGLRRLIDDALQPFRPRWSPDGRLIVFSSNADQFGQTSANVWVIGADGTGLRQLTFVTGNDQAWAPDWSPDGRHIVFTHGPNLEVRDVEGTTSCTLRRPEAGFYPNDPDWGGPGDTG